MIAVPAVETERLLLRGHRRDDLADCAAMWGDLEVTRHIGGRPFTEEEVWARLLRYLGHWDLMGFGYWIVHERASGRFVGEVGFADWRRAIEPPLDGAPELGWALSPWCWGRGYATEAVAGALAWGDAHLAAPRSVCIIDLDHHASRRVAEKNGYRESGRATYRGADITLFERGNRSI